MKTAFFILVLIHGIIHLPGFLKAFEIKDFRALTLPIPKSMGIAWLLAAILLIIYGISGFTESKYSWLIGFIAVLLSQFLITWFWKDAKFGTIPNVLILVVALVSFGAYNFNKTIAKETNQLLSTVSLPPTDVIRENDIQDLPSPVQRWMRSTGIIGKEKINVAWVKQKALMQMNPEQEGWYPAKARQYTTFEKPAFLWTVKMDMMPLLTVRGRDKFVEGKGEMLIKLNSLINVVNASGTKIDQGTLQRYLGEMVWYPSLALSRFIEWEKIDEHSAKATMTYNGISGSGTFYFNDKGDFTRFVAMRYKGDEAEARRYPWVLTVESYSEFEGIRVPQKMEATWKMGEQDWTWLKLEITDIRYNEQALQQNSF